ncbi:ABC transporter permease [Dorea formicigenerans]|uniref:ABC transporter permease n=1 Tax=Dorea formicigenerans TaxID=39486 RepID=A0A3E4PX22_9FIRM|nr:ABC transporter permease [Dorea formicigenerans]RGK84345.1 ABC transporter permease [Dorea formicigenerans]
MKKSKLKEYSYTFILLGVLLVVIFIMAIMSPYFFSWKNCRNILNQSAIYLVLSIGMTFVICAGQIDLSVGAIIGFSGVCVGLLLNQGVSPIWAILIQLLIGVIVGIVNGIFVAYGKINSFIVTLGMMTILRGITLILTNSSSVFGFGNIITFIGSGKIGPVNMPIILSLVIATVGGVLLHRTTFGNYCLFIGTNEIALNRSGVNVKKYKIIIFALCGLCASVAGLIITARLNSAEPLAGQGYEMDAIAASILGGTSMQGGKGNIIGTIIACLILNIMKNGLTLLAISSHYQEILTGLILLISVLISESEQRRRSEV